MRLQAEVKRSIHSKKASMRNKSWCFLIHDNWIVFGDHRKMEIEMETEREMWRVMERRKERQRERAAAEERRRM